jgi:hypothetical protein
VVEDRESRSSHKGRQIPSFSYDRGVFKETDLMAITLRRFLLLLLIPQSLFKMSRTVAMNTNDQHTAGEKTDVWCEVGTKSYFGGTEWGRYFLVIVDAIQRSTSLVVNL